MGKPALVIRRNEQLVAPLNAANWHYMLADRDNCEKDYSLLQIIPYITLIDRTKKTVFTYVRGTSGEESKLHTKLSIGLGGHIDELPGKRSIFELITTEALRELEEEIGLVLTEQEKQELEPIIRKAVESGYFILETPNPVDLLHLCVPIHISVDSDKIMENLKPEMKVVENGKFMSFDEAITIANGDSSEPVDFEYWSAYILKNCNFIWSL